MEVIPQCPIPYDISNSLQGHLKHSILHSSLPMLLHYEDRDSMGHSIEARVPFVDYRVIEFTQSLPSFHKLSGGVTKKVLRNGMKETLPPIICNRMDKLGFATPEETWFKQNAHIFLQEVSKAIDNSQGILNRNLLNLTKNMIEGKTPFNFAPWRAISFGKWMEIFSVSL